MRTSSKISFAVAYRYTVNLNRLVFYKLTRFARLWNKPNFTKNELTTTMQSYNYLLLFFKNKANYN